MKPTVNGIALALLIIGGLNWGLVGLMGIDLVQLLFGFSQPLATAVYALVGIAALYALFNVRELALPPVFNRATTTRKVNTRTPALARQR